MQNYPRKLWQTIGWNENTKSKLSIVVPKIVEWIPDSQQLSQFKTDGQ